MSSRSNLRSKLAMLVTGAFFALHNNSDAQQSPSEPKAYSCTSMGIAWSEHPNPNVQRYKIKWGESPGLYNADSLRTMDRVAYFTVRNGQTNFFRIFGLDADQNEYFHSAEIPFFTPFHSGLRDMNTRLTKTLKGGDYQITYFPYPTNSTCSFEMNTNCCFSPGWFTDWTPIKDYTQAVIPFGDCKQVTLNFSLTNPLPRELSVSPVFGNFGNNMRNERIPNLRIISNK